MGKIGKKSSAFINHKPFHPGNWQNQEKVGCIFQLEALFLATFLLNFGVFPTARIFYAVLFVQVWLAEQKHKEEQRKQQELAERRAEEFKIEELRRALRGESDAAAAILKQKQQQEEEENAADALRRKAREAEVQQKRLLQQQAALLRRQLPAKSSLYAEDVFTNGHTSVFGSFFCKESKRWGYRCCASLERSAVCSAAHPSSGRNKKRKLKLGESGTLDDLPSGVEGTVAERDSEIIPRVLASPDTSRGGCITGNRDENSKEKPSGDGATWESALTSRPLPPRKGRVREAGVAAYLKLLENPVEGCTL